MNCVDQLFNIVIFILIVILDQSADFSQKIIQKQNEANNEDRVHNETTTFLNGKIKVNLLKYCSE